ECGEVFDAGGAADVRAWAEELARRAVVRYAVEFFSHLFRAFGFLGWVPGNSDCANGGKDGTAEVCEARSTIGGGEKAELTDKMIPLLVDLEREWRGGQNQFLLLLKGLYERGHAAELLAAKGSSLGHRAEKYGICVHYTSRRSLLKAARKVR